MGMMLNRRRVMGGEELPYDAEIEYLESTGTQYINTGVILQRADLCRMDIVYTFYDNGQWNINGLSGSVYAGPGVGINPYKCFSYTAGTTDKSTNVLATHGVLYRHNLDIKNSIYIVEDYLNGTEVYHNDNITKSQNNPQRNVPMIIFGYYSYNGAMARVMKIYKAAIYENDVLLRDFIPVRIGTTGYMYDKVSKQLFGNSGTGAFILGPDK